jgi:hypothetical protein
VLLEHLRTTASPQLVVVEDAHWADEATLDVLTLLGRRIAQTRALVVVTFRDDELDAAMVSGCCSVMSEGRSAAGCRWVRCRSTP